MAKTTKVITIAEVEELALKTATFDDALLEDHILPAQRFYMKPFLGEDFYDEILTQVELSTLTLDNSTLLEDWLKPMLAHYIVYDAMPQIRTNITSKGMMINTSETSQAASHSDFSSLRNNMLQMGDRWKADARDFIIEEQDDDSSKFPDFNDCDDDAGDKNAIIQY